MQGIKRLAKRVSVLFVLLQEHDRCFYLKIERVAQRKHILPPLNN